MWNTAFNEGYKFAFIRSSRGGLTAAEQRLDDSQFYDGITRATNAGMLAVNRSNAYTLSAVVSGSGALSQLGPGTTTLTGANTYSGATTVNGNESETPIIPKYGVSYQLARDNMVYATAAKGFRNGGANPAIPTRCDGDLATLGYNSAPDSYKSDSVWSYEIGSKNRLLDGRVRLDTSIFEVKWSGIQEAVTLPSCGLDFVANLGQATSRGFDFQGDFLLTDHLTTGLSVGYNHATFDQSILSPPDPVTGIRPVIARKGDSLGVNPWTAALSAQYDFVAWGRNGYVRADDQFASRQSTPTTAEDPGNQTYDPGLVEMPQTNLLSLRLGGRFNNGIDLSLFVKNALNSHPVLSRNQTGSNIDLIYVDRTFRPRTIGITLISRY